MKCEQLSSKPHPPTFHSPRLQTLRLRRSLPAWLRQNSGLETGSDGEVDVKPTALLILAGCETSMILPQLSFLALCRGNLGKMATLN